MDTERISPPWVSIPLGHAVWPPAFKDWNLKPSVRITQQQLPTPN
jgi:hypothetical protein